MTSPEVRDALPDHAAGVLLHPTSLPGRHGIGDLGPRCHAWIRFLEQAETPLWQVLPLGPTGYGDSPYQCFSSFAGNPLLISPDLLVRSGLLDPFDPPPMDDSAVDFGPVIDYKTQLIDKAFATFQTLHPVALAEGFADFKDKHASWIDDYALFRALKDAHGGRAWVEWEPGVRLRDGAALADAQRNLADAIERHAFAQFLFFDQWAAVKNAAHAAGIQIIGDLPIYVAGDSADVWVNRHLFELDAEGRPLAVAGVPPDYFSETGQLWGNPLYRWDVHHQEGYAWWTDRIAATLDQVDIMRIDHFRAFANYWRIPTPAVTAADGAWVDGPGEPFFDAVAAAHGSLPIIAEDLGELSEKVPALLERYGLPGMKLLLMAFDGDEENAFLPEFYEPNSVAYTGTHDNDTIVGWWRNAEAEDRSVAAEYLDIPLDAGDEVVVEAYLEALWGSASRIVVAPLQDLLCLGPEARMNTPATTSGNWSWRFLDEWVTEDLAATLADRNRRHGRTSL